MDVNDIFNLIITAYKEVGEIEKLSLLKYVEYKIRDKEDEDSNMTIMEAENACLKKFFKPTVHEHADFYLDIINHVNLEIHRLLNETQHNYKVDICIENEYAQEFLLRVEDRFKFIKQGFNPVDIEEYICLKYNLPTFLTGDKKRTYFLKKMIKANHQILCEITNTKITNPKGRPKMFEELRELKKKIHATRMKDYMKHKYETFTIVSQNLLTDEELIILDQSTLPKNIKQKLKIFSNAFLKNNMY